MVADSNHSHGNADWFDRPMRWAQLTLVENDPGNYDPHFWLDYFRRVHADAACLSAGGCVAYYPTQIPFHYRSPWMGDSDPFGELLAGCRAMDMVVIARTDPHAIHQDAYEAHPEWVAVDVDGQPRRHWASPELWVTCALGPYNFEFMTEVHREIVSRYQVDGIFSNRWTGHGICYCASCRRLFRERHGLDLPRSQDPRDPAWRAYLGWRQERLFQLWRLWDGEIRAINPRARFIANSGGGALSSLDMKTIGELSDTLFADRQARHGLMAPWANGKNAKEYRATLGNKPIGGIFSVGVEEKYRWKDSVQSPAEIRLWVLDGIANGLRPWFTKFAGSVYDPRWLQVVEELYGWHHRHERYLRNQAPLARVALVYSQQTAQFYGGQEAYEWVETPILGWYQALVEARIPFEMVHDGLLDAEHVDRYRTLILPNIAALSDHQCRQLSEFVARGGSLVATFETSRYNQWGELRPDLGLGHLFGVQAAGKVEGPMRNAYLRLEREADGRIHPLLAGLEDAPRIIHGAYRLPVQATAPLAHAPLTLIPSYPDLPMEAVYPRVERTEVPEVYLRETAGGRVVYFPWDIDRIFWEVLCVDHGRLLANAVRWATDEPPVVTVEGPGVLDVTVWRQEASMTVHLVNLTNPMMMKGPARELLPVGRQVVTVRLPVGTRPRRVQLLNTPGPASWEEGQGVVRVEVPSVLDLEVVAIDLDSA
ncbi:beta-galactosidase trimerization domain-containing protein [Litorilinea aerophila]|nr:beta-galactosidase trimerization domain-containing protein [Litorilinea aerophila]MCC9076703.1 beta-galactosidase trimerization domain-containing protein [Litorilinea aerophila]